MGSTSYRHKISEEVKLNEAEDKITNLPENLISHILSFLPTNCAVATNILFTQWKWMWTSLTNLHIEILDVIYILKFSMQKDMAVGEKRVSLSLYTLCCFH